MKALRRLRAVSRSTALFSHILLRVRQRTEQPTKPSRLCSSMDYGQKKSAPKGADFREKSLILYVSMSCFIKLRC